ncbi:MAG TPA: XdhC/CoxI family protein [Thermomicrobiales bacterium]
MDIAFLRALEATIAARRPVATATVMDGPLVGAKLLVDGDGATIAGSSGDASADGAIARVAADMLRERKTEERGVTLAGSEARVFVESYLPPPSLVVIGAAHIAIPLTEMAQNLGFDVTLIDAREWFLTEERFPHVARRILAWPDKGLAQVSLDTETYLVILSHDPKFERPALKYALPFPLRYIGAIGSRKTHADRIATLRAEGVSEDDLARIHAPIGLDIGAVTPEEVAVSILAEMLAVRSGHSGGFMQRERGGKGTAA